MTTSLLGERFVGVVDRTDSTEHRRRVEAEVCAHLGRQHRRLLCDHLISLRI